jgi:hypothetical protein
VCSFAPAEGPELVAEVAAETGAKVERGRTFTPEEDGTEGFYVALMRTGATA